LGFLYLYWDQTGALGEPLRIVVSTIQSAVTENPDSDSPEATRPTEATNESPSETESADAVRGGSDSDSREEAGSSEATDESPSEPESPTEGDGINSEDKLCEGHESYSREQARCLWMESKADHFRVVEVGENLFPIFVEETQASTTRPPIVRSVPETKRAIAKDPLSYATLLEKPRIVEFANRTKVIQSRNACVESSAYCFALDESNTSMDWDLEIIFQQVSNTSNEFVFASTDSAEVTTDVGEGDEDIEFHKALPSNPCVAYTATSVMTLGNGQVISSEPSHEFTPHWEVLCNRWQYEIRLKIPEKQGEGGGLSISDTQIQGSFSFGGVKKIPEGQSVVWIRGPIGNGHYSTPLECGQPGINAWQFDCTLDGGLFLPRDRGMPFGEYDIALQIKLGDPVVNDDGSVSQSHQMFDLGEIKIAQPGQTITHSSDTRTPAGSW
jgi:hypothetical protein